LFTVASPAVGLGAKAAYLLVAHQFPEW